MDKKSFLKLSILTTLVTVSLKGQERARSNQGIEVAG